MSKGYDDLPDDIEALQDMLREAKMQLRRTQLELDVRQATLEIVKKDPGADPDLLTNAEKAAMVEALRSKYRAAFYGRQATCDYIQVKAEKSIGSSVNPSNASASVRGVDASAATSPAM